MRQAVSKIQIGNIHKNRKDNAQKEAAAAAKATLKI